MRARYERGQALLLLLMVVGMGSIWYLTSRLNAESASAPAIRKARNAEVLIRAKQALIGYVAAQAIKAGEDNPGALPCPEHAWYIDIPDKEGGNGPSIGVANPGYGTANCSSIGRYPWRTLGTEKFTDSSSEPLWYVVGPAWRKTSTVTLTTINSNSAGDITADGQQVVALIIAPGPAISAQAGTTAAGIACAARNQSRSAPTGTMDPLDYLECYNSATLQFSGVGPSNSFNDQIVTITAAELMPGIEAAIAKRIEREIAPALAAVYAPATWGFGLSNAVYPYPAAFANPGPGAGTSSFQGAAANYKGLLPFNQANCTVAASNPRCSNNFLAFSKSGVDGQTGGTGTIRTQSTCAWQASVYVCTGQYNQPSISVQTAVRVTNVAMGLRAFDASKVTCTAVDDVGAGIGTQTVACAASVALQSDGSAILTISSGALPDIVGSGWGTYANYMFNIDRLAFGDHALLDTANATTGWFARNEWFRLVYYAVAPSNTAIRLPLERSCTTAGDCLSVANLTPATKSALLVLAGRSINGVARPSATLGDYLEFGNASATYESRTVTPKPAIVYTDTGGANAYAVAIATLPSGATFLFRAANANTGTSTLNTAATGTRALVNTDGSNLAAATIAVNAAVQVTWDGTQFVLSKRPFNDRIVAISSN